MSVFAQRLAHGQPPAADGRRWLYVPYDQLSGHLGPLSREPARALGIVLVENPWKAARRPYHTQKLALVLANQRHFALEQAARGVAVRYVVAQGPYGTALEPLIAELGRLRMMEPAERELRADLQPLVESGAIEVLPHEGWLTSTEQFRTSQPGPPWRMDAFYRVVRRATGVLMERGKPIGGKFSFDTENRRAWRGEPAAPTPPAFEPDPVTQEACDLVERRFAGHPGRLAAGSLPATAGDAARLWAWAIEHCLPQFGPFEDAMSRASTSLFHTRISSLLNLHRLLPRDVVRDVERLPIPLASREGFIRQVLGWREFVRHVHRETDGFRHLPGEPSPSTGEAGARPSALGADAPLPSAFWGRPSGLACLDHVVREVWDEGYSHHITRLMVLSNIATLLDVSPRELTDWFWAAYTDAYDWVVEPNVLGMGTFAVGDLMTTKPYVAGAAYLARMSDYCDGCTFDPARTCPLTRLYWAFLDRHAAVLRDNPRLRIVMAAARKRPADDRARDRQVFEWVRRTLQEGNVVTRTPR